MLTQSLRTILLCGAAMLVAAPAMSAPAPAQKEATQDMGLVPTQEEMEQARLNREAGKTIKDPRKTQIEEVRDSESRVKGYVVDPALTHIKYSMDYVGEKPVNDINKGTLSTPKFLKVTW